MPEFTDNISTGSTTDLRQREVPGAFLPRWTQAGSEEGTKAPSSSPFSVITDLYNDVLAQFKPDLTDVESSIKFTQNVGLARNGYVARLTNSKTAPKVVDISTLGSLDPMIPPPFESYHVDGIKQVHTLGDLLFKEHEPLWFYDNGVLYLRNIDLIQVEQTTDSDGILDLTSVFSGYPRVPDSPVWISNVYGDVTKINPDAVTNLIVPPLDGSYRIRYSTTIAKEAFDVAAVLVDDVPVPVSHIDFPNLLDSYGDTQQLKRLPDEDNVSFRHRCQSSSLSSDEVGRISSALGTTTTFVWEAAGYLSVPSTGAGFPNLRDLPQYVSISETPSKNDDTLFLSRIPYGNPVLYYKQQIVPVESYQVTSSQLQLLDSEYVKGVQRDFIAKYTSKTFSVNISPSGVLITPESVNPTLFYGVVPSKVRIELTSDDLLSSSWDNFTPLPDAGSLFD
jgi:hypothetical protein